MGIYPNWDGPDARTVMCLVCRDVEPEQCTCDLGDRCTCTQAAPCPACHSEPIEELEDLGMGGSDERR